MYVTHFSRLRMLLFGWIFMTVDLSNPLKRDNPVRIFELWIADKLYILQFLIYIFRILQS